MIEEENKNGDLGLGQTHCRVHLLSTPGGPGAPLYSIRPVSPGCAVTLLNFSCDGMCPNFSRSFVEFYFWF